MNAIQHFTPRCIPKSGTIVPNAGIPGDYDVRGIRARGLDLLFAPDELSDTALSAAIMAQRRFDPAFPGWEIYRTIINGTDRHWFDLRLYADGMGRALAESRTVKGQPIVKVRGVWIRQAARDAMFRVIQGAFPQAAAVRAIEYGISDKTYSRLRNLLAGGFLSGLENFRGELYDCAERVFRIDHQ